MALRSVPSPKSPRADMHPASENQRRVRIRNTQLSAAKVSNPNFGEKCGNSPDISKGISQSGIYRFESSKVSQAVGRCWNRPQTIAEKAAVADFCNSAGGLQTLDSTDCQAKSRKVSGRSLKYSRFRETATGDWVRPTLRGRVAVEFADSSALSTRIPARSTLYCGASPPVRPSFRSKPR
jgi:hypothetical protein